MVAHGGTRLGMVVRGGARALWACWLLGHGVGGVRYLGYMNTGEIVEACGVVACRNWGFHGGSRVVPGGLSNEELNQILHTRWLDCFWHGVTHAQLTASSSGCYHAAYWLFRPLRWHLGRVGTVGSTVASSLE